MGGGAARNYLKIFITVTFFSLYLLLAGAGVEGTEPGAATLQERESALLLQGELAEEEKRLVVELLDWDVKIEAARLEQERLQREIPRLEEMLAASEVQLAQSRAQLAEGRERLGRWVNHLYRCGALTYLDVVLGATGFNDFIERAERVYIILDSQVKMIYEVRSCAETVQVQAEAVRLAHEDLSAKSEDLALQLREMETARAGREQFLGSLMARSADLAARVVQAETQWYRSVKSLHYLLANLQSLPLYNMSPASSELTFGGLQLAYTDEEINRKFSEMDANLAGFSVRCYPGRFTVTGPAVQGEPDFMVEGHFQMLEEGKVRYQPEALTLAGMPVSREVLGFISSESGMVFYAGGYLESFRLTGIEVEEGRLIIILALK